jgi:hypothetical protein
MAVAIAFSQKQKLCPNFVLRCKLDTWQGGYEHTYFVSAICIDMESVSEQLYHCLWQQLRQVDCKLITLMVCAALGCNRQNFFIQMKNIKVLPTNIILASVLHKILHRTSRLTNAFRNPSWTEIKLIYFGI